MLSNFVNLGTFKICRKVQKSLWFDGAQLLRVSDLLLGTVCSKYPHFNGTYLVRVPFYSRFLQCTNYFLGVLWQQRDKVFSRWKERYFVLTCDYLQCFKKSSPSVMHSAASEMGRFIFKLKLTEVGWVIKKNYFFGIFV